MLIVDQEYCIDYQWVTPHLAIFANFCPSKPLGASVSLVQFLLIEVRDANQV